MSQGTVTLYKTSAVGKSEGIGDVTSNARGSGARFNTGKPAVELIPLRLIAASVGPQRDAGGAFVAREVLRDLGDFQVTGDVRALAGALVAMAPYWTDCARVFDYGRRKYAAWNWAKGMPWSAVIGCAARHALAMMSGEERDAESGELHAGHLLCNLVMLRTYVDTYPEGNDLPSPELFKRVPAKGISAEPSVVKRSVIVHGPMACGKTRNAKALAEHFGLTTIIDDWDGRQRVPSVGALVLTNVNVGAQITVRGLYEREGKRLDVWTYVVAARAAGLLL
jgi:hypothetical protein